MPWETILSLFLSRLLCLDIRNSTMTISILHANIFLPLFPLPLVPFPRPHERCVSPSGPQTLFQGCQLCLRLDGSGSYGLMPPTGECFLCLLVIVLRGGHSNHFFNSSSPCPSPPLEKDNNHSSGVSVLNVKFHQTTIVERPLFALQRHFFLVRSG